MRIRGFAPGDEGALSTTLLCLDENRKLSEEIGRAARQSVLQRYSVDTMAGDYEVLYLAIRNRRHAGPALARAAST